MKTPIHPSMEESFGLSTLFRFVWRHRKQFIIIGLCAGLLSAGLSFLLPNYYRSHAVLVPSDSNSVSKALGSFSDRRDILDYGDMEQSEYLMQLLSSQSIALRAIERFDLGTHYKTTRKGKPDRERCLRAFNKNIEIRRTDFLGVELSVWDRSPEMAKDIAMFMIDEVNLLRNRMKQQRADSALRLTEESYNRMKADISVLEDSMTYYSIHYGISSPLMQKERMTQEWAKQIAAGNTSAVNRLESKMRLFDEHVNRYTGWSEEADAKRLSLREWFELCEHVRMNAASQMQSVFVMDYPLVAENRDKPKRKIIVIGSVFVVEMLALFVLAFVDHLNRRKRKPELEAEH